MSLGKKGFSIPEVLGSLAIILIVSLASGAITKQVLMTSKKSKAVGTAISLESAFLAAIDDAEQEGYKPNIVGENVLEKLREGQPPQEIQIWSTFGVKSDKVDRKLLYILKRDSAPNDLYLNFDGDSVTPDQAWAVHLQAVYKKLPTPTNSFPQYSVAYEISGNPKISPFRSFGSKGPTDFDDKNFSYPISQLLYIADSGAYSGGDLGSCDLPSNKIISLFSVDLQTGAAKCVAKGNECQPDQVSVGYNLRESGHLYLDLVCKKILKCSCKEYGEKNWVISSFNPASLLENGTEGASCGRCRFAFKSPVEARVSGSAAEDQIEKAVCPSKNYTVTDVMCRSEVVNVVKFPPGASTPDPCDNSNSPIGQIENIPGSGTDNRASCRRGASSDACYKWNYSLSIVSAQCILLPAYSGEKIAKTK